VPLPDDEPYEEPAPRKPPLLKPAANLEDVITGKADLRDQLRRTLSFRMNWRIGRRHRPLAEAGRAPPPG
jgi:hypothetical protein